MQGLKDQKAGTRYVRTARKTLAKIIVLKHRIQGTFTEPRLGSFDKTHASCLKDQSRDIQKADASKPYVRNIEPPGADFQKTKTCKPFEILAYERPL